MDKEFVPYEQAIALKELGFDKECFGYYTGDKRHLVLRPSMGRRNEELNDIVCTAPTFSQAFRWFREKYNFDVGIAKDSHDIYHFQIDTNNYGNWILPIFSRIYEEAELECLKKLIEIVKKK